MTTLLTAKLLVRFETALRAARAPVVDFLAPGVSDAELDGRFKPLGIDLPQEARVWWRWHNGVRAGSPPERVTLIPNRAQMAFTSAAHVVERLAPRLEATGTPELTEARLVPFVSEKPLLYVSCSGPRQAPARIWVQHDGDPVREQLPSLGTLVETWCSLIEQRIWTTSGDRWRTDRARVPRDWPEGGIV